MPKHPSTQADNLKLRFSVYKVEVTRQGMDAPKTISQRIEHESEKVHVHIRCFLRFMIAIDMILQSTQRKEPVSAYFAFETKVSDE